MLLDLRKSFSMVRYVVDQGLAFSPLLLAPLLAILAPLLLLLARLRLVLAPPLPVLASSSGPFFASDTGQRIDVSWLFASRLSRDRHRTDAKGLKTQGGGREA